MLLMPPPDLIPISVPFVDSAIKLIAVHWSDVDGGSARVRSHESGRIVEISFPNASGIRMLHELDLASIWLGTSAEVLKSSWLFEVRAGGWRDVEVMRADFNATQARDEREFMIACYQECLSIFSSEAPSIREITDAS